MTPYVGGKVATWFSDQKDGMSTIMKVRPYRGKYTEFFTHVLEVSAPRTRAGFLELSWDEYSNETIY